MTQDDEIFLRLRAAKKEEIARDIWRFELTAPEGAPYPSFGSMAQQIKSEGFRKFRRLYYLARDREGTAFLD